LSESEIDKVERAIGRAAASESTFDQAIQAHNSLRVGQDRSNIVLIVFLIYSGVIAATITYLLYRGIFFKEPVFDSFTEVMKIAVIPIVTLVIGYYFGTEKIERHLSI
jgi:hypothetical protein